MELLGSYIKFAVSIFAALLITRILRPDPLKQFPGPALARWTRWYRAYFDIVKGGRWLPKLVRLHETYGPVVRVGPNELHFTEPTVYGEIYNSLYKMRKDDDLYSTFEFGMPTTLFTISDPKEHSAIKSLFSSYFSRRSVQRLEHMVQGRVDKLISQLLKNHRASPVNMNHAYRSVTLDIITLYTLRTSIDATSFPSFQHPALHSIDEALLQTWFFRYFPFLRLTFHLPKWLAILLSPSSKPMAEMQEDIEKLVDKALQDYQQYDPDSDSDLNVFYTLLSNSRVEGKVRQSHRVTREWLIAEGVALRVAGSDTVGNACTIGTRCLMRDSRVRQKLVDELETAWPDKGLSMPLERLEKLPYLTAVIKESLRLSHGTVTPMSRVVSESGAVISGHPVPPGTIVSIASPFIDMNPDIFVDPTSFYPERWIEDKENTLNHYLVTFGKGPRSCLGINLAWSELYMILGNVFRKLDFHSDGDLQSEVDFGEFFVPLYKGDALSATVSERA